MATKAKTKRVVKKDPLAPFRPVAKAIAGFVTPGILIFLGAITSGSDGGSHVTMNEWSVIGLAMLGTGGAVFAVRNGDKQP